MKRKTFIVLFFIKKGKLLKNGEAPVRMRITVDRRIVEYHFPNGISFFLQLTTSLPNRLQTIITQRKSDGVIDG